MSKVIGPPSPAVVFLRAAVERCFLRVLFRMPRSSPCLVFDGVAVVAAWVVVVYFPLWNVLLSFAVLTFVFRSFSFSHKSQITVFNFLEFPETTCVRRDDLRFWTGP